MKKKSFIMTLCVVYIFLCLYFPPILFVNFLYITLGIGIIYIVIQMLFRKKIVVDIFTIELIIFLIGIIVFQSIIGKINGYGIGDSCNDLLLILFGFVFGAIIVKNICLNNRISNEELLILFFIVGLIQAILCIIAYVLPEFQNWFIEKMISYGYSESRFTQLATFRWYGVATQLGFGTPVVQTVLSIWALYISVNRLNLKYLVISVILLFSAIINARTAIIIYMVGICAVGLQFLTSANAKIKFRRFVICILILIGIFVISLNLMKKISYTNYRWIVDGILDFIGINVDVKDAYVIGNYFTNMDNMKFPPVMYAIVGAGVTPAKLNIGFSTDIGYINDIWKYGLVITIVIYYYIFKSIRRIKNLDLSQNGVIAGMMIIILSISNIKGIVIAATPIACLYIMLLCAFPKYKRKDEL